MIFSVDVKDSFTFTEAQHHNPDSSNGKYSEIQQ